MYFGVAPTLTSPLPAEFTTDVVALVGQMGVVIGGVLIAVVAWNLIKFAIRKASKLGK